MKKTVALGRLADFSGLNIIGNIWDNVHNSTRYINKGLVVFRNVNAELLHIIL